MEPKLRRRPRTPQAQANHIPLVHDNNGPDGGAPADDEMAQIDPIGDGATGHEFPMRDSSPCERDASPPLSIARFFAPMTPAGGGKVGKRRGRVRFHREDSTPLE